MILIFSLSAFCQKIIVNLFINLNPKLMKKLFLMLAFTGLVASVSAATPGDKDKDKKEAKKEKKACCKDKSAEGKSCSASDKKEGKACCKKEAKTAEVKAETK